MKTTFSIIILVIVVVIITAIVRGTHTAAPLIPGSPAATTTSATKPVTGTKSAPVVCAMDAKLCPDGSYVGRTGPTCQFKACPADEPNTPQNGGSNFAPYKAGVNGVVTFNFRAYPTTVYAFRSTDLKQAIAIMQTDANGIYSFSLPPGSYVLGAGENNTPQCSHPEVTVGTNSYVTANISCK